MARIAPGELERLKTEVSLTRLIEAQGLTLTRQGKDFACRCPWHDADDTPSCVITPSSNLWHCFGCNAGGTVIDWVMRAHKISFRHACELLAQEHPALAAAPGPLGSSSSAPTLSQGKLRTAQSFALDAGDQALLDQVIAFYHETLLASPEALAYLDKRGLGSRELIQRFRLGYANRTLAYRLAPKQYKAGAEARAALQRIGILRDSGHEHLNGSLVIPLFGESTADSARPVVGAYGRKVLDNLRAGTPKLLYLPGPHCGVFNREGLAGAKEIILCESLIDALTFWQAGYQHVTSCYGVHGLTDELLVALTSSGAERVLIAFDRDEAGDRGAEQIAKQLTAAGLDGFRLLFPKGEDANSYALAVIPATKSLGLVIRSSQWLGQGAKPAITTSAVHDVATPSAPPPHETVLPLAAASGIDNDTAEVKAPALLADAWPEPVACAVPTVAAAEPDAAADPASSDAQLVLTYGARRYRVRGGPKMLGEA
jgi:DNA primase catalytic core